MKNYDKYKVLKEELKAPRFENEDEEIEWFTTQLYGLYKQSYRLRQENQQLKEEIKGYQQMYFDKVMIINKAIEHLELKQIRYLNEPEYRICSIDLQEIKDILKGENK